MSAADFTVREPAPWQSYRERQGAGSVPYQSCDACQRAVFYPRVLCPHCGSAELEWRSASGRGVVYSQAFIPARQGGGHQVVLIDMVEGFRVMGVSAASGLSIGDAVVGTVAMDDAAPDAEPRYVFEREAS